MKKLKNKLANHNSNLVKLDGGPFTNRMQMVGKLATDVTLTQYIRDDSLNYEVVYHKYVKCDNCNVWHYEENTVQQNEISVYRRQMMKKTCKSVCMGLACSHMWSHEGWHQHIEDGKPTLTWSDFSSDIIEGVNRLV